MLLAAAPALGQSYADCPGVIINELPAGGDQSWVGDSCILVASNGDYYASHAQFGPMGYDEISGITQVFRSTDRGQTWTKVNGGNNLEGILRGSLFEHQGAIYILGSVHTDYPYPGTIRKSVDQGATWTSANFTTQVSFSSQDNVILFNNRLWLASSKDSFSAAAAADPMVESSWSAPRGFPDSEDDWLPETSFNPSYNFIGEGQIAASPTYGVVVLPKVVNLPYTALGWVHPETGAVAFDPDTDFVPLPGGEKKFGVRFDEVSGKYFILSNPVLAAHKNSGWDLAMIRNTAAVLTSTDLRNWRVEKIFLYSPNVDYEGWQYFNFDFDGEDMAVASRTAFDVGGPKPTRGHDSNLLTFHNIPNFRSLVRDHVLRIESGKVNRYERTQHRDAPLGVFALGNSFAGAPLTNPSSFGVSGGEIYIQESGGRILRFDSAGNFLGTAASAPGGMQAGGDLTIPPPAPNEFTWSASGNGSWTEPTNWHYWNRPGANDTAVFGSAATTNATVTIPTAARNWKFDTAGNFEDWTTNYTDNATVADGVLSGQRQASNGPQVRRINLSFLGNDAPEVRVRLRVGVGGTLPVYLHWGYLGNNSTNVLNENRKVRVDYTGNNTFQEMVFNMAGRAEWAGERITKLRVDPIDSTPPAGTTFEIDWIKVPLPSDHTRLAGLRFDHTRRYTLAGNGSLQLRPDTGAALIDVRQGNHTISTALDLGANATATVADNATISLSGALSATTGAVLVKEGNGTLALTGNNTFAGTVEARAGTVAMGRSGGTLADTSTIALNGGMVRMDQDGTIGTFRRILAGSVTGTGTLFCAAYDFAHPSGTATLGQDGVGTEVTWTGPLLKSGDSTLILADTPAYSGGTTINAGVLQIGAGGTAGSLGSGPIVNNGALVFDRSDDITVADAISGNGTLTKNGAAKLILTGNNTYTGTTTIAAGRLDVGVNDTSGSLGGGDVINNGTLMFNRSNDITAGNLISGNGTLLKGGGGRLTLTKTSSTFSGQVQINSGSVRVARLADAGQPSSIGTGAGNSVIRVGAYNNTGYLEYEGDTAASTNRQIQTGAFNGNGKSQIRNFSDDPNATLTFTNATFNAAWNASGSPRELVLGGYNTGNNTILGNITNNTGANAMLTLRKNQSGTWILAGNNTYTGSTLIDGGRLVLTRARLADAAAVQIASGAVLELTHAATDTIGEFWLSGTQKWRGHWGPVGSPARYQTAALEGSGTLDVTGGPAPGYDGWEWENGLTGGPGMSGDEDGDGFENLLEFVLGGNPLAGDVAATSPAISSSGPGHIVTFHRADDSEGAATCRLEYNTDLGGTWSEVAVGASSAGPDAAGITVTVTENEAAPDGIEVRLPDSLAPDGRLFVRLKVTAP
jgi:autotransporter-associated beta strand protein